jgi:hypothetical protein
MLGKVLYMTTESSVTSREVSITVAHCLFTFELLVINSTLYRASLVSRGG